MKRDIRVYYFEPGSITKVYPTLKIRTIEQAREAITEFKKVHPLYKKLQYLITEVYPGSKEDSNYGEGWGAKILEIVEPIE